jgi:hypothetical protein
LCRSINFYGCGVRELSGFGIRLFPGGGGSGWVVCIDEVVGCWIRQRIGAACRLVAGWFRVLRYNYWEEFIMIVQGPIYWLLIVAQLVTIN